MLIDIKNLLAFFSGILILIVLFYLMSLIPILIPAMALVIILIIIDNRPMTDKEKYNGKRSEKIQQEKC